MASPVPAPCILIEDRWAALRAHTAARIALGRAGASLPTREVLAFGLAHAQARDAVLTPLDTAALRRELEADLWPVIEVRSGAADRAAYLARPDWGRRLHAASRDALTAPIADEASFDLVFVASDGLSSTAVQRHVPALLRAVRPLLAPLRIAPVVIATQARVALADEVGEQLRAGIAVSLIGERPGLSAPDSLGIYLTHAPKQGRSDAERNCISNVRPAGLDVASAARQLAALVHASRQARCSGVALRFDGTGALPAADAT